MDSQLQLLKRNLPEDSPKLLNEKLRAGELTVNQVKLASQLDYKPARQLFPNEELVDWFNWNSRKEFLAQFEKPFLVSLACDYAERVIHIWEKYEPKDTRPQEAIIAARKWVENPSEENRQAARAAANAAYAAADAANAANAAYAAYAAANAAYAAANAAYAAANAAYAAANAAYAAASAVSAIKEQEYTWQKTHLAKLILSHKNIANSNY